MNPTLRLCLALLLPVAAGTARPQEAVSLQRQDQKTIAVMAYAPKVGACRGVAIISPGAGMRKGYSYLGETMAGLGSQTVVVGHRRAAAARCVSRSGARACAKAWPS